MGLDRFQEQMTEIMAKPAKDPKRGSPVLQFKMVLAVAQNHFEASDTVDEIRLDHTVETGKQVVLLSQKDAEVRMALGLSKDIWISLTDVVVHAIPSFEKLAVPADDATAEKWNVTSSSQAAANIVNLMRDVECVTDLCTIARNILVTKQAAQDLAAEARFDQQVLKLIDVCNRVTARAYDGETNVRTEEKWQKLMNAYKKLLVTGLQFLHNFVMNNERRKLLLWMDLFGNSNCADSSFMGRVDPAAYFPPEDYQARASTATSSLDPERQGSRDRSRMGSGQVKGDAKQVPTTGRSLSPDLAKTREMLRTRLRDLKLDGPDKQASPATTSSAPSSDVDSGMPRGSWTSRVQELIARDAEQQSREALDSVSEMSTLNGRSVISPLLNESNFAGLGAGRSTVPADDETMQCTPADAAQSLHFAKEQLVDRLFGRHESPPRAENNEVVPEPQQEANETGGDASETAAQASVDGEADDDDDDEEDEEEDDPYRRADEGRGLLTDIPLVLGPSEIEAVPMIIQSGIVDAFTSKNPEGIHENMQAIRCNILISQESGRNLLRELLIFVAAWDLADDELYVKMMVQIMEAILINGLVPYTYQSFAETKDIISPAQAVVIKLLTHIFRSKTTQMLQAGSQAPERFPVLRVHVLVIRFMFAHFRQSIIPETCGLIYLQGQIRRGQINAEDFPLNFWDMERVYEGVYQFLEFLAVLTEIEAWKRLLVKWEITHELIVLLRELEEAIPNGRLGGSKKSNGVQQQQPPPTPATNGHAAPTASSSSDQHQQNKKTVVSVERPFDPDPPSPPGSIYRSSPQPAVENPEEFEWRNLKKLVVLVLSSLVWKSPVVQNQVRKHGGVELILQCCNYDSHNPYIREHSIMCLRFLLEGNELNSKIVRELEPRHVVPSEVLDSRGWETFIDHAGRVGLRRKGD
ncbi:MAG: copper transport protein [Watsoniomyces obsoletus]|nr:MAG: copper transport protein [Watsoniomyces obsoletus]